MKMVGKKLLMIIILFSLPTTLAAQTITSIVPNSAQQGESLSVTISGQNTYFSQGTPTAVYSSQGSTTINATSFSATSDTLLSATFDIPIDASTGNWNVHVNGYVGEWFWNGWYWELEFVSLELTDGFTITSTVPSPSLISIVPSSAEQGESLSVNITGQNTTFQQGTGTTGVWFTQGTSTINASSYSASSDTSLSVDFDIPVDAATGLWDVSVETYIDGVLTLTDGFTIAPRQPITLYVDDDASNDPGPGDPCVPDPLEDGSAEHPFDAIQEAIDIASDGDTVVVLTGTFTGTGNRDIDYNGLAITVRSTDPNDPNVVAATVIDCNGSLADPHCGFYFHGGEDANSVVSGFKIINSYQLYDYGGAINCVEASPRITSCILVGNRSNEGNGVYCIDASPTVIKCVITGFGPYVRRGGGVYSCGGTISNCIIQGNWADDGGGLFDCSGPIENCIISGNLSGNDGGGILQCSGPITNCTISENTAATWGGGLRGCGGTISNCIIQGNSSGGDGGGIGGCNGKVINCRIVGNHAGWAGGGLSKCDGTISNCTIINNSADDHGLVLGGGGFSWCDGSITNCIISGNKAAYGGGVFECSASITNCIIYDNAAPTDPQMSDFSTPTYSCIQDWAGGGTSNILTDPCFVNPDSNDFHVLPDSPCIDAGDNDAVPIDIVTDLDGNPRLFDDIFTFDTGNGTPPIVDMGAYEYTYGGENLPDLELTSEDIVFGAYPAVPGEANSISATVWNVGNIPALRIGVSFSDSSGLIGSQIIPIIGPNDSNTVSIEHSWPDVSYQLITARVDPANNIEELDESNNTASKVYQIGYPADANAILDVSWNSAPACYTEGASAVIRGKAEYRIEITGADDIVSAALGSIATAQMTDSNGVVTNLQSTFTGPDGYFYIPFIVPDADEGSFTIEITVTDGTLTGTLEKLFCIRCGDCGPRKDLWIGELTFSDETPDLTDTVTICATIYAAPDNDETVLNVPVTFYAYPPTGGGYQIGSTVIDQMAPDSNETVCVEWTPTVNGLHRIKVIIGPGFYDDNYGNNYKYYNIVVGMFSVTASPKWVVIGQQVQITVDAREQLPSGQLDSITVLDSAAQTINVTFVEQPLATRWVYQTDPLPAGTASGTATITVTGTDSGSVQHTCEGYFEVYETIPDFWVHSCDVNFSDLNPDLGEPITIDAVVHADSSNPELEPDIPVTFYSKHLPSDGNYIEISQTQYTDGIITGGGESTPVSVPWQNAAKGEYVIKVQLGPGFSDDDNGNNAATRAILVGDELPFAAEFEVVSKTRTGRTEFVYDCNVIMHNQTGLTLENVELELTGVSSNMTLVNPYTAIFTDVGPNGSAVSENTCTFSVDRSEEINPAQINWYLTYQIVDICGIMQQTSSSTIVLGLVSDITGEGDVDFDDLVRLTDKWLWTGTPGGIDEDIAPLTYGDGIVNFKDFAILAGQWLK